MPYTKQCACTEPDCSRDITVYRDTIQIDDNGDKLHSVCELDPALCDALADILRCYDAGVLPDGKDIYSYVSMVDKYGNALTMDDFCVVEMANGNELSVEFPLCIHFAFCEALVAHGATYERYEDDDDREAIALGDCRDGIMVGDYYSE